MFVTYGNTAEYLKVPHPGKRSYKLDALLLIQVSLVFKFCSSVSGNFWPSCSCSVCQRLLGFNVCCSDTICAPLNVPPAVNDA
jgi:hypothetical protein